MKSLLSYALSGLIYAPKNLLYRAIGKPLKPKCLVVMATDKCNSRCLHCNIWKQEATDNPLTPAEIGKVMLSHVFDNIKEVINTGGECTLRNDLAEIIRTEHISLPCAKLTISTNGLLPDKVIKMVDDLGKDGICISVGTSLDGVGEDHDRIRGVIGNFSKVAKLLSYLGDNDVSVGFVLSDNTAGYLPAVSYYLEKFNRKPFVQWCNDGEFYHKQEQSNANKQIMYNVIKELSPKRLGGLLIKNQWLGWLKGKPINFPCFALHTFCVIKCNGDVVPCLSMWDSVIGNIRANSIDDIWKGQEAKYVRKKIKNCKGCLNSWGAGWSYYSAFYPYAQYLLNPKELVRGIKNED